MLAENIQGLIDQNETLKNYLSADEQDYYSEQIEKIKKLGLDLTDDNLELGEIINKIVDLEVDTFSKKSMMEAAKNVKKESFLSKLEYISSCIDKGIDTREIIKTAEAYWTLISKHYDAIDKMDVQGKIDEVKLKSILQNIRTSGKVDMAEIDFGQNYLLIRKKLQEVMELDSTSKDTKLFIKGLLGESINIETGKTDSKAMEQILKDPKIWQILAGLSEKQIKSEEIKNIYDSEKPLKEESEERKKEIKEICEYYGVDSDRVRDILENSENNVYIVKSFWGGYKALSKEPNANIPYASCRNFRVKAVIYNNNIKILKNPCMWYGGHPSPASNFFEPERVVLSDNLLAIDSHFFEFNWKLKRIRLPNGLKLIRDRAFYKSGLESIEIPGSVEIIEMMAFSNSSNLKTVTLNEGLKYIGGGTFMNTSIDTITVPSTVTDYEDFASRYTEVKKAPKRLFNVRVKQHQSKENKSINRKQNQASLEALKKEKEVLTTQAEKILKQLENLNQRISELEEER